MSNLAAWYLFLLNTNYCSWLSWNRSLTLMYRSRMSFANSDTLSCQSYRLSKYLSQ
ncbi:hypothetical protein BN8_05539 [Fibrisoma limi BUZ 3]|uniref:Uncharacterized protein n=1 Tax=Fibrisoma limi BUZ 3 TaxID=1185876 RepID=I2GQP1_9BACT|nr:hypothetical protein BN8_05539 [Fibrisoma limi BUZ 3]